MEGIITVQDSRENYNKMQEWRAKEAATISKNQQLENKIDNVIDGVKSVVTFAGTAATIALAVCPVDGPVGETLTALATPALVSAVEASRGLLKGLLVNHDLNQRNLILLILNKY